MIRLLSMVTAFGLYVALSVLPASGQESVEDLAAKTSAELRLLTAFQTFERMTSQINHFLVYPIEAERGGWGALAFVDSIDYENSYIIRNNAEDLRVKIARANSSIVKSKVATKDELKSAEAVVENLNVLVALASQIADMVAAGELDAAALSYHENGQRAYENALRGAQSSVGTVQKRLGKTLLNIRIAK